jgi:hypothetical protein
MGGWGVQDQPIEPHVHWVQGIARQEPKADHGATPSLRDSVPGSCRFAGGAGVTDASSTREHAAEATTSSFHHSSDFPRDTLGGLVQPRPSAFAICGSTPAIPTEVFRPSRRIASRYLPSKCFTHQPCYHAV